MSGTALYCALIEAGTSQETAKEAAAEIDTLSRDMSEVKLMVRILVALVIAAIAVLHEYSRRQRLFAEPVPAG